jgi:putative glutamine transport system substrate-binding protein
MRERAFFKSATWLLILFLGTVLTLSACRSNAQQPLLERIKQRGVLVAGVKFDSKPFGYLDTDGQLKGFEVDLMREIAKRLLGDPYAVEFQQVLSSTRVIAIQSGNLDLVAATMTITPERAQQIDFSAPYYTAHQAVVVPRNSSFVKLSDLYDKRILFVLGTTSEQRLKQLLPKAEYIGFKTATDAFSALKAARGDAMTTDDIILGGFLAQQCQYYRLLNERLSDEPYGLGLRKDPQSATLKTAIDNILAQLRQDGTLSKLEARWLPKDSDCTQ